MFYVHPVEVNHLWEKVKKESNVYLRCEKMIMWLEEWDRDKIRCLNECKNKNKNGSVHIPLVWCWFNIVE